MLIVHFKNNYHKTVIFDIVDVKPGDSTTDTRIPGNFTVRTDSLSTMNVLDLGKEKLNGYELSGANGILFRYETIEVYSRYDNDGEFNITLDKYGDFQIETIQGNSILIQLTGLTIKKNK